MRYELQRSTDGGSGRRLSSERSAPRRDWARRRTESRRLSVKELTATSTEKMLEATEEARAKARPYADKAMEAARETAEQAKDAAGRATDAAKPYIDKSKEAAQKAYDDALRVAKELMEKKPQSAPKND